MRYSLTGFILAFLCIFSTSYSAGQTKSYTAAIDSDGVQRATIVGGGYYFDPDYIVVKTNVPVELTLSKEAGIIPHNFVINEPEAGIDINEVLSTKPKVIRFTPAKAGEYPFYCDKRFLFFKSHREKGMKGLLKVTQ